MKSAINLHTVIIPTDDTVTVFDEYKNDLTIWAEISNVHLKKKQKLCHACCMSTILTLEHTLIL